MQSRTLLQFLLGGLIVVGQTWFANHASPYIAGMIYSAPTLFLPTVYFTDGQKELESFALNAALMLVGLFAYDISFYLMVSKLGKTRAALLSFGPWAFAAGAAGHMASRLGEG